MTQQNNHCSLIIDINNENKIKCSIIDNQNKEQSIQLKENQQEEYLPITIAFEMNEIIVNEENNENTIYFFSEWINNPQEMKEYKIKFQNDEYSMIAEVLFAMIVNKYKKIIEKKWIIDETICEILSKNGDLYNRITIALNSIGLKNIVINPIQHEYQSQGEKLHIVLEKEKEYLKYKTLLLQKGNQSNMIDNTQPLNEEKFNEIVQQHLKTKERNDICQLDNYCIFLASKWLDTIDDHINLVKTCKRVRCNMEKFHFNPLSLTRKTREFFPNIQTLYKYVQDDLSFEDDERIHTIKNAYFSLYLSDKQKHLLEEWTSLKCFEIIFNSDIDDWSQYTSEFNRKIKEKKELVFLIESEDGQKFGYFCNKTIVFERVDESLYGDNKTFVFNLESNGRLEKPMKFDMEDEREGSIVFWEDHSIYLIQLGDIFLSKKDDKDESFCIDNYYQKNGFNYNKIDNALCGTSKSFDDHWYDGDTFDLKRIVVIQMK